MWGDLKPKNLMWSLDVDVLKKHELNAERVRNNPMFFFAMLFPICPPSAIGGDMIHKCHIIQHWLNFPTSMQPWVSLVQGWIGHGWHPTTIAELVHWSGVPICHWSLDGRPHTIHACWRPNDPQLTLSLQIVYQTVDGSGLRKFQVEQQFSRTKERNGELQPMQQVWLCL